MLNDDAVTLIESRADAASPDHSAPRTPPAAASVLDASLPTLRVVERSASTVSPRDVASRQLDALDRAVGKLVIEFAPPTRGVSFARPESTTVWGVPFSRLTLQTTLHEIERRVVSQIPGYFITANLNYAMLTADRPELRAVNERASFIVADGMPIVWRSRLSRRPLPERVAGSDLIYAISHLAAARGYRMFLLGGAPSVAETAARKLVDRYPKLNIVGTECPPFRPLSDDEESEMIERVRRAAPDILFVALGQPKGELWLARHCQRLGAPVSVQLGASFDFVAGSSKRAPRWTHGTGLEWLYRMCQEPRRLAPRYARNAWFLARAVLGELRASATPAAESQRDEPHG